MDYYITSFLLLEKPLLINKVTSYYDFENFNFNKTLLLITGFLFYFFYYENLCRNGIQFPKKLWDTVI